VWLRNRSPPTANNNNNNNNNKLASTHIFYPVAIEAGGTRNLGAVELAQEIGRWATLITGEPIENPSMYFSCC